ncbi:hypothetical protein AB1K42_18055 [Roseibium algicola]|uniref:RipA family octameric membrane protein n=1 Tax=Roseibium algicola TaxID=2857014 RepID=UPI003459C2D4
MTLRENLSSVGDEVYGEKYSEHCMEIYKLYVASAEAIGDRREKANTFFLALNTATVGFIELFADERAQLAMIVPLAGISLCVIWSRLIKSYRAMNTGKFKVIHEMEQQLPLAAFDAEWEALGQGKDPKIYAPFTKIEALVPWVFAALYAALLVMGVIA